MTISDTSNQQILKTLVNFQKEVKSNFAKLESQVDGLEIKVDGLEIKIEENSYENKQEFKKVKNRLDMIGKSVAYLETDAPAMEEFEELETKVGKLENIVFA